MELVSYEQYFPNYNRGADVRLIYMWRPVRDKKV
jgi:hypothetical protein